MQSEHLVEDFGFDLSEIGLTCKTLLAGALRLGGWSAETLRLGGWSADLLEQGCGFILMLSRVAARLLIKVEKSVKVGKCFNV